MCGYDDKSGHFMAIIGYRKLKIFTHARSIQRFDFEKATYTKESGLNVYYPIDRFIKYLEASSLVASGNTKKGIRFYYIGDKKIMKGFNNKNDLWRILGIILLVAGQFFHKENFSGFGVTMGTNLVQIVGAVLLLLPFVLRGLTLYKQGQDYCNSNNDIQG